MGIGKTVYTIEMPKNATEKNGNVKWKYKGKEREGVLTKNGRVRVESEYWAIWYRDEDGNQIKETTKTKSREAALQILMSREATIDRIRAGVVTREETDQVQQKGTPIENHLKKFETSLVAAGRVPEYIRDTMQQIRSVFGECGIENLSKLKKDKIETWVADKIQHGTTKNSKKAVKLSPRTINGYVIAVKGFVTWCIDSGVLKVDPLAKIKKLNEEIGRKKDRRSFTEDELKRLMEVTRNRHSRSRIGGEERALIYSLLAGTGLRVTELSLATPSQFDFERNRFTVVAAATKNKRSDVLPVRPALAARLREWIGRHEIKPRDRIFNVTKSMVHSFFKTDLKHAGIKRIGDDGRSLDVHSFRRTFGTMLARAGVPLTTTQRLMRHSTPELTAKLYIDVEPIDMAQAVDKLPEI